MSFLSSCVPGEREIDRKEMREEMKERERGGRKEGEERKEGERKEGRKEGEGDGREGRRWKRNKGEHHIAVLVRTAS